MKLLEKGEFGAQAQATFKFHRLQTKTPSYFAASLLHKYF